MAAGLAAAAISNPIDGTPAYVSIRQHTCRSTLSPTRQHAALSAWYKRERRKGGGGKRASEANEKERQSDAANAVRP